MPEQHPVPGNFQEGDGGGVGGGNDAIVKGRNT